MHHAISAFFVIARPVTVPIRGFHQFLKGFGIAFAEQVARPLPAEDIACRVAPRRAVIGAIAGKEVEKQCRLIECPTPLAPVFTRENLPEQLLRATAVKEMLLIRRPFIRITRRDADAIHTHRHKYNEKRSNPSRVGIGEKRAVDEGAKARFFRLPNRSNGAVVNTALRDGFIVLFAQTIKVNGPAKEAVWFEKRKFLFQQQRVCAYDNKFLPRNDA